MRAGSSGSAPHDPVRGGDSGRRLTRYALLLGVVSVALVVLIGGLAFLRSRESLTQSFLSSALERVQAEVALLDVPGADPIDSRRIQRMEELFRARHTRFKDTCLFALGPDGKSLLQAKNSTAPATDMSHVPLHVEGADAPRDLSQLQEQRRDWVGVCNFAPEHRYLAAFACAKSSGALVGMYVPWEEVMSEIDTATVPWILGLALIALVLLPSSLWMLRDNYIRASADRERALAESRAVQTRLDLHLENSPLAVIEWDSELCALRWSAGAERLFGWTSAEILGHSLWQIVHPEDRDAVKQIVRRLIAGSDTRNTTYNRNLTKDGRILRCRWSNSVLMGEHDQIISYFSIAQDVTERHQAQTFVAMHNRVQQELLEERPLEEVFDTLVSGMECQFEAHAGSVLLVDGERQFLKLSVGAQLSPVLRAALIQGIPIALGSGSCGHACATKQPQFCADIRQDPKLAEYVAMMTEAGTLSCWSQPILTPSGDVLGTFAIFFGEPREPLPREIEMFAAAAHLASVAIEHVRQTAEQKRLTRRLEALHSIGRALLEGGTLETVVQSSLDSVRTCLKCPRTSLSFIGTERPQGLIVSVSTDRPTALPARQKQDRHNFPFDHIESLRRGEARIVEDLVQSFPDDPEAHLLATEGVRSLVCAPMLSGDTLIGTLNVGFARLGVATREEVELAQGAASLLAVAILQWRLHEQVRQQTAELEERVLERTALLTETNAELESYVHTVSHDLRAPLRSIQGFGQALIEDHGLDLGAIGLGYLQRMTNAAERMDEMMQELLSYSRLGRAELHRHSIDLELALASARDLVASEFGSRFVQIEVEHPLGHALGHMPTLVQVLANLLSNAAKFVPAGRTPRIRISRELDGARIRLHVEDNGIGIPLAQQERIWRVFERLHGVETYPGTGIGLAIVRRAMERMGGASGVVSNPAEGSRFWIELDRSDGPQ